MERLESFTWDADENICHTIHRGTISSLAASCPRLKSLHLHLAPYREPEDRDVNPHYKPMEISLFGNLTSLTLRNIQGDLTEWQGQTSKALIKSPGLQPLDLSIDDDYIFKSQSVKYVRFLNGICHKYARDGRQPLRLRTLRMSAFVLPENDTVLTKFTDFAYLEELAIDNDGGHYDGMPTFSIRW